MKKKKIITIISALTIACSCVNMPVSAMEITVSSNPELWERFLKYDLCILHYNSLTDEEKELCRFIFETELNSEDTIICKRARRTLDGYDVGRRATLEDTKIYDNILDMSYDCSRGQRNLNSYNYLDIVPDIMHIDYDNYYNEYWIDGDGTEKILTDVCNDYYLYKKYDSGICIESTEIKKSVINMGCIADDNFVYKVGSDDTLYVCRPLDYTAVSYIIPDEVDGMQVVGICGRTFKDCYMCEEIIFPDTLKYIESYAFENCNKIRNILLPHNIKAVGSFAFKDLDLDEVNMDCPYALIDRLALAFSEVKNLYINTKSVSSFLFENNCKVTLGDDVVKIGSVFSDATVMNDSDVIIPDTVKIITNDFFGRFGNESRLGSDILIPDSIELFGTYEYSATGKTNEPWAEPKQSYIAVLDKEWYLSDDTIISGYYGTEAHSYAVSHNLVFNPLYDLLFGAANGDGKIAISDMVALHKYLLNNGSVGYGADMNKDGKIDVFDMVLLRKQIIENN
ncbi:MAG: leucine-rich repeat protein [Ruminococcus sp.]|nr:leucine-rich repeat protein [Ruminococcus sp.]